MGSSRAVGSSRPALGIPQGLGSRSLGPRGLRVLRALGFQGLQGFRVRV